MQEPRQPHDHDREAVKDEALAMLEEVGVKILMYVFCSGVSKEGDDVKGVFIESKEGREVIDGENGH